MFIGLFIIYISLAMMVFYRYLPVRGVIEINSSEEIGDAIFVDTRDYQTADREGCTPQAYRIPLPYVKRQYNQLPDKNIILIVADRAEKNLYARLLKRKGFKVVGYIIPKRSLSLEKRKQICS